MEWVEIIHLRTSRNTLEKLTDDFDGPIKVVEPDRVLVGVRLYHHPRLDTDLSIHIHWKGDQPDTLESALGLRLAHICNEYGLTNHSVWVEKKNRSMIISE